MTTVAPEKVCGEMCILDESGDIKTIWDASKPDEVAAARDQFNKLTKGGKYSAFYVKGKDGEQGKRMHEFDPDAEKIILVPQLVGG